MTIIDTHCDVLSKMLNDPHIDFRDEHSGLDASLPRLIRGNVAAQCFAVYLPERIATPRFEHVLQCVDLFYTKIVSHPRMMFVKTRADLELALQGGKIGALLTLEGAEGLEGNLANLRILFYLGARMIGLTWNHANWAADGVMEPRQGGLTAKGKALVKECNRLGMIVDVSHLAERGFWQLTEIAARPFVASHSNAQAVCPHPRNLNDEQIKAIIDMDGRIGVTFVPPFVNSRREPVVSDLLLHIEHICALGGVNHIGFGSDFDGIERWIPGLEHAGNYDHLANLLYKHYKSEQAEGFLYRNWFHFFKMNLPEKADY